MKTVLSALFLVLSFSGWAQPSHWRYALYLGLAKPYTHLTTANPIPDDRLIIDSPTGPSLQAVLERSIRPNFSLRTSIKHQQITYNTSTSMAIRDTAGRVLGWIGSGGKSLGAGLTVGTLGVTFNLPALGRTIFTAGLDGVIRVNSSPDQEGLKTGGRGSGTVAAQGQVQNYETIYEFETQRTKPLTYGLAARIGMDYRISKRGLFSVEMNYTKGFGYVRRAISTDLQIDGVINRGSYSSRASNLVVQVGYKHNLFRVNPLDPLQFTPYNKPELNPRRLLTSGQRQNTFRAKTWLYELRSSYQSVHGASTTGVGANAGYFFANRYSVGLSADYQRYGSTYAPSLIGSLLQLGPVVRAYAGRGRVAPYLEGGYQIGWIVGGITPTRFVRSVPITLGFSIRVNKSVRLNASYALRYIRQGNRTDTGPGLPQFSLSFSPKTI